MHAIEIPTREEIIHNILLDWAEWHQGDTVDIGYPKKSPGFFHCGLKSFEDMHDSVTAEKMAIVQACINSLPAPQGAAIERAYGICAVYRFPRDNYQECLENAFMALSVAFRAKGVEA